MMLAIACNSPIAAQNYPKSMEYIGKQYSSNLRDQIFLLASGQIKSIDDLAKNIASHTLQNFNASLHCEDALESELSRELENGRIVRLLCKFGFINERPEFDHDSRWSETGDRYYIKLFRDYVFHSVDENGAPVVDVAHVLTCLNKLDAGVDEKIMLVSRDNLNCFVLSYKDVSFPRLVGEAGLMQQE
jgi:PAB-dependent poly(A)-specific ribonuclease subunit 3